MTTRTITAVYDTEADARRARDQLVGGGLDGGDVRIVSHALSRSEAGNESSDKSIWESLRDFLIVDADRPLYAESLRRGGCLLTARVDDELSDTVIAMLEQTNAIDLDQRSQQWRDEGWSPEGLGSPASMHGYAPGAGPTTDTIANELRSGSQMQSVEDQSGSDMEEELWICTREIGRGSVRVRCYVIEASTQQ